jgi:RNA polymerase sigma-70 factor (ECF subfamily)
LIHSQRIGRAKNGSLEAFDELYSWLLPLAYRYAWVQVGDRNVAEEITSESFVSLVAKLQEMPDTDLAVLAWIRRVVRNKVVDWIRHQQVQRQAWGEIANSSDSERQDSASLPSDPIESDEQRLGVHELLQALPDDYRNVLELRYLDNLSTEQIASFLGLSVSAANSMLFRARNRFRVEHRRINGTTDESESSMNQVSRDSLFAKGDGGHR